MLPTRVGMNRTRSFEACPSFDAPHASGDEPLALKEEEDLLHAPHASGDEPPMEDAFHLMKRCSPREWG